MEILLSTLSPLAIIPTRANDTDAGYDLYATEDYILKPLERKVFKTNIAMAIPIGYYGRIAPRSGRAVKEGLDVLAGVIDESFRGDIGVVLINLNRPHVSDDMLSPTPLQALMGEKGTQQFISIRKGEKIAQIIIEKCHAAYWKVVAELPASNRGEKGFGSSGN